MFAKADVVGTYGLLKACNFVCWAALHEKLERFHMAVCTPPPACGTGHHDRASAYATHAIPGATGATPVPDRYRWSRYRCNTGCDTAGLAVGPREAPHARRHRDHYTK